jgi:hypothetical protein
MSFSWKLVLLIPAYLNFFFLLYSVKKIINRFLGKTTQFYLLIPKTG